MITLFYVDDFVVMYKSPTTDAIQRKLQHTIEKVGEVDNSVPRKKIIPLPSSIKIILWLHDLWTCC